MPTLLAVHEGRNTSILAPQSSDPSCIARGFGLPPEALFEVVEGVTFRYTTDSAQMPCTLVELRPPWKVKLPELELDWQRLRRIRVERFHLSQGKFAEQLKLAGEALLVPNGCDRHLVQLWERGKHQKISPTYQLALVYLLGYDVETICQGFPAAQPEECIQQLTTLAQLAEAFLVLADAHGKLREFNERLATQAQKPDTTRPAQPRVSAVSISVPCTTG